MRANLKKEKGVSIGAIVLIGAVFTIVVALLWGVATVSKNYQVQLERTPSIKAKARFDHLKHYSNYSLWLAGHWGTDKYGGKEKIWWEEGSNLVPSQEEFARRLGNEISDRYTDYFGWEDVRIEDSEINVTSLNGGTFKINSTPVLKVSSRWGEAGIFEEEQKEVEVFDELNHTHLVKLRIFLLRDKAATTIDNIEGLIKYDLWQKFAGSATKNSETRINTGCGDCSYPNPNPTTKESVTNSLNNKLNDIAENIEQSDATGNLGWSLSIKNADFSSSYHVSGSSKWDTGIPCLCENTTTGEEMSCKECETKPGCKILENRTKCKKEFDYFYNITPTVRYSIKDLNNDYKVFESEGYRKNLNLNYLLKLEVFSTKDSTNPYQDKAPDDVF